jgi:hypothetical protein
MSRPVEPRDVSDLCKRLAAAMRPAVGVDWDVRAGSLTWSVEETLEHLVASLGKYTLYVGSRASRYLPLRLVRMAGPVTRDDWLAGLPACAGAFQAVAEAAPAGTRAFHAAGMADVEGYAALACAHVLEHGHDISAGLRVPFEPPGEICAAVTDRLFPWAPPVPGEWTRFLYVAGRIELPGIAPVDPRTPPLAAPLAEWDGAVPSAPDRPAVGHVFDSAAGRWEPIAQPD